MRNEAGYGFATDYFPRNSPRSAGRGVLLRKRDEATLEDNNKGPAMKQFIATIGGQTMRFAPCEKCGSTATLLGSMKLTGGHLTIKGAVCADCGTDLRAVFDPPPPLPISRSP